MTTIEWLRWNKRLPVKIIVDSEDGEFIASLCNLLVKDHYAGYKVPPRGRQIMLYNEDAITLGMPGNPQATGIAGKQMAGDVVIVTPDTWSKMEGF